MTPSSVKILDIDDEPLLLCARQRPRQAFVPDTLAHNDEHEKCSRIRRVTLQPANFGSSCIATGTT